MSSLTENDVPGAQFLHEKIESHTITQLRRWLKCRKLSTSGTKQMLVDRCRHCVEAGRGNEIDVAVDEGKWYLKKFHKAVPVNVSSSSSIVWGVFPSTRLPEYFSDGSLYHYFIESVPNLKVVDSGSEDEDADKVATDKPFCRGEKYVDSDYVGDVMDTTSNNIYLIRSRVKSSMKKKIYRVMASISLPSGQVVSGTCECTQQSLGRCSHVMASLLYVRKHISKYGLDAQSCTSKPRQWGKGTTNRAPKKVVEGLYKQSKKRQLRANFDPRPTKQREEEAHVKANNILSELQFRERPILWQIILSFHNADFEYSANDLTVLRDQVSQLRSNIIAQERVPKMIEGTEQQNKSPKWFQWRSLFLTAPTAKVAFGLQKPEAMMHYLQRHMWGLHYVQTKEMKYGSENEVAALADYKCLYLATFFPGFVFEKTGLYVNGKYPGLACSPDGIVIRNGLRGLVEVKCPYVLKDVDPATFPTVLTPTQRRHFCLVKDEKGLISLRSEHLYMYQVQMGMAITETYFCDFVVWSKYGLIVTTVDRDMGFNSRVLDRLILFYTRTYVFEYFCQRTVRNLPPITDL